jgi:hypothetical protein
MAWASHSPYRVDLLALDDAIRHQVGAEGCGFSGVLGLLLLLSGLLLQAGNYTFSQRKTIIHTGLSPMHLFLSLLHGHAHTVKEDVLVV